MGYRVAAQLKSSYVHLSQCIVHFLNFLKILYLRPVLERPVKDVPGLGADDVRTVLGDEGVGDDGAQGGVGQCVEQLARHEVPDADTAASDDHGDPGTCGDAEAVNGQLVLVDVLLFLKDVVEIPYLMSF